MGNKTGKCNCRKKEEQLKIINATLLADAWLNVSVRVQAIQSFLINEKLHKITLGYSTGSAQAIKPKPSILGMLQKGTMLKCVLVFAKIIACSFMSKA